MNQSEEHRKLAHYDRNSPLVQAIERGYDKWEEAGCHDIGCGCVTVYIHNEIHDLLRVVRLEEANWWYHKYAWPLEERRKSSVVEGIDRISALEGK